MCAWRAQQRWNIAGLFLFVYPARNILWLVLLELKDTLVSILRTLFHPSHVCVIFSATVCRNPFGTWCFCPSLTDRGPPRRRFRRSRRLRSCRFCRPPATVAARHAADIRRISASRAGVVSCQLASPLATRAATADDQEVDISGSEDTDDEDDEAGEAAPLLKAIRDPFLDS